MSAHPERFHALDATRAFALLLGVVFHIAWLYVPFPVGTPVSDDGSNAFLGWFFVMSHTFRMQLFFLIAGFFGRLVVEKRGVTTFVKNRFKRIAVPLVLFWMFLLPVLKTTWIWGMVQSEQLGPTVPPLGVTIYQIVNGHIFVGRAAGGGFSLMHLWFLYYLILIYVLVLAGRPLVMKLVGEVGRGRVDRLVGWLARSAWGPVVMGFLFAPLLYLMAGWNGVTTPSESIVPVFETLAVYLGFFVFGWLLHRVAGSLGTFFRAWPFHLGLALLLSLVLYRAVVEAEVRDTGRYYPSFGYADVEDWGKLRAGLAGLGDGGAGEEGVRLSGKIAPWVHEMLEREGELNEDQRVGVLLALNGLLPKDDLFTSDPPEEEESGPPPIGLPDKEVMASNRALMLDMLDGLTGKVAREQDGYALWKAGHALLYSLVMCLLVFASLGFFQRTCQRYSPGWRYVADSSYWVYLLHLPVVVLLVILTARLEWPVWVKFPLVMLVAFAFLYATYHLLVRSTPVGKLLNGRKYPFHLNPLKSVSGGTEAAPKASQ